MELAEIRRILGRSRLVTLTGPGGSGKTRLAVEVVHGLSDGAHPDGRGSDGVAWIDLAPLADSALLTRHVSAALGLAESLERSPLDTLVERLRPFSVLLVLDNCEHLVAECARLVHALLGACPHLAILATSRESLGVGGETSWIVPPLSLPASADPATAAGIAHSEAVELFVGRAKAVQQGFELTDVNAASVAYVCRQLDGIPLAIELAAARMNVLPVEQIARRLDDVFGLLATRSRTALPRHRTLRDAIDWSYELLDECEQRLFRRLAVFSGGFTLDAAEGVCAGAGVDSADVLDLVSALVDKSLVRAEPQQDEARFSLLEPVRQYAWDRLIQADEGEPLRARHASFFLERAERAEPHVRGGTRGTEWMVRLERDHGNLRAAADWAIAEPDRVELQLRLDTALLWFYFGQGYFQEPRQRLTRALSRAEGQSAVVLGRAHAALGYQAIWQGDYAHVAEPLQKSVRLLEGEADTDALSFALTGLGAAVGMAGDGAGAQRLLDRAQASLGGSEGARAGGFPRVFLFAFASYWRGVVSMFAGDIPRARESLELCVAAAQDQDDHQSVAHPLGVLARVLTIQGDHEGAHARLSESLRIHAEHDDRWGLAEALEVAAHLAAAEGSPRRAARLLGAADALRSSMGLSLPPHQLSDRRLLLDAVQPVLGPQVLEQTVAAGRTLTLSQIMAEALGTSGVASAAGHAAPPPASPSGRRSAAPAPPPDAPASVAADADLAVLALGPLQILRRGEALEPGTWGSAKPRELLLFLLCNPGGATREQIGHALWPDALTERVANSFHVTLHRLRKALGDASWIAKAGDRYTVTPHVQTVFDAPLFEREVTAGVREIRTGRGGPERLRAALAWYRGPFLADEVVGDWHMPVRDRLLRAHLDGLVALGGHLVAEQRWADAADVFGRAIADDDLHEEAYRQLMLSLARSGDRSQALRLYQRLCTLLDQELGARPEPETVALFERLQEAEAL